jgi:hypothetical protein
MRGFIAADRMDRKALCGRRPVAGDRNQVKCAPQALDVLK